MKKLLKPVLALRNSLNKLGDYGYVAKKAQLDKIPKIIHQIYHLPEHHDDFPPEVRKNINSVKRLNHGWDHRLYDANDIEDYIQEHFPNLLKFYQKINPSYFAARADFFRYLVIYNEGGVYLDIKANMSKPLDEIIDSDDQYVLSHWPRSYPKIMRGQHPGITNPIGELQQWHISAVPGHPLLKSVIENVCNNIAHYNPIFHDYGSWGVFNLTGPIAYTEAIYPLLDQYPHRLEADHLELGYIYYALGPENETSGHHKIFKTKHYSKLEESIVKVSPYKQAIFTLSKPFIKLLKTKYNK